ncbi:hypothetical protein L7F22_005712 [Adiantum nelumboides]|nr:hypothetical protein [Adiantum nelumboides]
MAWVTLQCPCGNIHQRARCGASLHSPVNPDRKLKCTDACLIAQRNIKLAEALGLNPAEKSAPTTYEKSTLAYYSNNKRYADEVESTLIDFIRSSRHGLILPPANRGQRQFTHELADAFKLVSESVDAEPRRSVSVRRRQESKVPHPLLSEAHRTYRAEGQGSSALGQLRRPGPSSTTTEDGVAIARENRFPLNAVLLEGVFGHDEPLFAHSPAAPSDRWHSPAPVGRRRGRARVVGPSFEARGQQNRAALSPLPRRLAPRAESPVRSSLSMPTLGATLSVSRPPTPRLRPLVLRRQQAHGAARRRREAALPQLREWPTAAHRAHGPPSLLPIRCSTQTASPQCVGCSHHGGYGLLEQRSSSSTAAAAASRPHNGSTSTSPSTVASPLRQASPPPPPPPPIVDSSNVPDEWDA